MIIIKRLIIHDTNLSDEEIRKSNNDTVVNTTKQKMAQCIGCFDCWLQTPGVCKIGDDIQNIPKLLCEVDEFILITNCTYGGYSPYVKNFFDRSIGFLLPLFTYRSDKRMHHLIRREKKRNMKVYFYGDITKKEQDTAIKMVRANALNLNAESHSTSFYSNPQKVMEVFE